MLVYSQSQRKAAPNHLEWYAAGLVFVVSFLVYVSTLAPGLHFGDGPELATAAHVLGVPHPTGYPLYMLLLKAWLLVTGSGEVIFRTSLFSAVCMSMAMAITSVIFFDWRKKTAPTESSRDRLLTACAFGLGGAFLQFHWSNAVVTEVYSLQFLLMVIFVRALQRFEQSRSSRWLVGAAVCFGLGLAHHRLSLFLLLPLLFTWWMTFRRKLIPNVAGNVLLSFAAVAMGLAFYLYLPMRAATRPPVNWGNPVTLTAFLEHVRGGEFMTHRLLQPFPEEHGQSVELGSYLLFTRLQAMQVGADLAAQVGSVSSVPHYHQRMSRLFAKPSVAGGVVLLLFLLLTFVGSYHLRRDRLITGVIAAIALQNLLFIFLYNIPDISDYYLFPFWALWFAAFVGLKFLADFLPAHVRERSSYGLILVPVFLAGSNWQEVDRSENVEAERIAALVMPESRSIVPRDSVIITRGDFDTFPAWYNQFVRGQRRDLLIVGTSLLRQPWYRHQFTPRQIDHYHLRFPGELAVGTAELVKQLGESVIEANLAKRAVFTTSFHDNETLDTMDRIYRLVPVAVTSISYPLVPDSETSVALYRILPR